MTNTPEPRLAEPPAAPAPTEPAPPPAPPTEGPLVKALRDIAANCDVGMVGGLSGCDEKAMEDGLKALELPALSEAIATDCRLLTDPDIEVARMAMARLQWLNHHIDPEARNLIITQSTVECLRAGMFVPEPINRGALVPVFAAAALAAGEDEVLWSTARVLPGRWDRRSVILEIMRFGGPRARPLVERILADEPDPELRGQALRCLTSRDVQESGPEYDAMCELLGKAAGDPTPEVSEHAFDAIAAHCPAKYPRIVEAVATRQTGRTLTTGHVAPLVSMAGGHRTTPERQAEVAGLLERLVHDKGLDGKVRADALYGVFRQDAKRGRKLASKFRRDPDPQLTTTAGLILEIKD